MRIFFVLFALSIASLSAQEKKVVTKEGTNTFKVVYYNQAGNIIQQGFVKNKIATIQKLLKNLHSHRNDSRGKSLQNKPSTMIRKPASLMFL